MLLILCASILAGAQSTDATISGVVVDPVGKVIPDAKIEIVNDATGVHYSSETNGSGIYSVAILPPGEYRVQVSKVGFKTLIKPGVVLNVQSALALNFTLPVGATSASITVEAGAQTINTNDASVSTVIDRTFVANMPLNGRSFQDLLTLAPGVSQTPSSYGSYGTGYSGDIVVNGQRTEANYFTADGVSANTGSMAANSVAGPGLQEVCQGSPLSEPLKAWYRLMIYRSSGLPRRLIRQSSVGLLAGNFPSVRVLAQMCFLAAFSTTSEMMRLMPAIGSMTTMAIPRGKSAKTTSVELLVGLYCCLESITVEARHFSSFLMRAFVSTALRRR
jgi:hypothetical protein